MHNKLEKKYNHTHAQQVYNFTDIGQNGIFNELPPLPYTMKRICQKQKVRAKNPDSELRNVSKYALSQRHLYCDDRLCIAAESKSTHSIVAQMDAFNGSYINSTLTHTHTHGHQFIGLRSHVRKSGSQLRMSNEDLAWIMPILQLLRLIFEQQTIYRWFESIACELYYCSSPRGVTRRYR